MPTRSPPLLPSASSPVPSSSVASSRSPFPPEAPREPCATDADQEAVGDADRPRKRRKPQRQPGGKEHACPAREDPRAPHDTREADGPRGEQEQPEQEDGHGRPAVDRTQPWGDIRRPGEIEAD